MSTRTDLPLSSDPSSRYLPWIIGLMMYLASLSIVIGLSINKMTYQWSEGLNNYLTLSLPLMPEGETEEKQNEIEFQIFQTIHSTPGIKEVKSLSIKDSLDQLGVGTFSEEDLKILPKILEIEIKDRNAFNAVQFSKSLKIISPDIQIEDHLHTKNVVYKIAQSTQTISFFIVSMIILGTISIIAFTSQMSVIIHRNVIEILYLVGATRSYIAKQFQKNACRIGFQGGMISIILGGLTLFVISLCESSVLFLDKLMRFPFVTLVFLSTAALVTFFITLSAHLTVRIALKNGV
jgi:cell division transport system permease protein